MLKPKKSEPFYVLQQEFVDVSILSFFNLELCTRFTVTDKQKSLRYIYNYYFKLIMQVLDSFFSVNNNYFFLCFYIEVNRFSHIVMFDKIITRYKYLSFRIVLISRQFRAPLNYILLNFDLKRHHIIGHRKFSQFFFSLLRKTLLNGSHRQSISNSTV